MPGLCDRYLTVPIFHHLTSPRDLFVIPSVVKAIILDFDGTTMKLNYTEGMRQKAYRKAIQSVAVEVLGRELGRSEILQCHNPAISKPEQEMADIIAARLSKLVGSPIHGSEIFGRWLEQCEVLRELTHKRYGRHPQSAVLEGIPALLDGAEKRDIPVSVCTAGAHQFVEPLLQVAGLMNSLHRKGNVFTNRHPEIRSLSSCVQKTRS
jgi:phosphoglycolate phosphatase-like HAD superfamily hydrolase